MAISVSPSFVRNRNIFNPASNEPAGEKDGGETLLHQRAVALARPLTEVALASEFLEVLTFSIGIEQLAIETRFVTEVLSDMAITPLPGADTSSVVGVTNLRGEVLAVASLSSVIPSHVAGEIYALGQWVIVLGTGHAQFGLDVTEVMEVVSVDRQKIFDPAPAAAISRSGLVHGMTNDARILLDGHAVLSDPRFVLNDSA